MAKLSANAIAWYAQKAGFSSTKSVRGVSELTMAVAIAFAESGGDQSAHNPVPPDNSYGLMQVNMLEPMGSERREAYNLRSNNQLFEPATNMRVAKAILNEQGWSAWSTFTNGAYARHLGKASRGAANPQPHKGPIEIGGEDSTETVVTNPFDAVGEFINENALKVALFVGGGALIVVGLYLFMKDSGIAPQLVKKLPMGKLAKMVK